MRVAREYRGWNRYGVAEVDVAGGVASFFIQVGDGWDRFIWTAPSGRSFEWTWDELARPQQLRALLTGRALERVTYLRHRCLGRELVVEGEAVDSWGGLYRG